MLLLIVPIAGAVAVYFFMQALLTPRYDAQAARLEQIATGGAPMDIELETATLWERLVRPLAATTADRLGALLPARLAAHFDDELSAAGHPVSAGVFSTALVSAPVVLATGAFALASNSGSGSPASTAAATLLAGAFGVVAPILWLRGRVGKRQHRIVRELPDVFDMIVVSVEAGLGFEAALARVADRMEGPLSDELKRALVDMNLGMGRRRALQNMASRVRSAAVRTLVSALLQADQTGMALGTVLRAQSDHLRTQRRQHAEQNAMRAPLKMLFPLIFFIFPSLFVVVLGPAMIQLMKTLGST